MTTDPLTAHESAFGIRRGLVVTAQLALTPAFGDAL